MKDLLILLLLLFILLLLLDGCGRPSLEEQLEHWDYVDQDVGAWVVWDIDDPRGLVRGYTVNVGRRPGEPEYVFDAGRIRGYLVPPILSPGRRWYFSVSTYGGSQSGEVSKLVETGQHFTHGSRLSD
ncbi:MAG: hypothetical protein JSW58_08200 [Candidatus Latescibacterota bacterium]|nr:MAG: hypothetical protein JSW58_08200 [Candidatus Latescibacterota bacterium]